MIKQCKAKAWGDLPKSIKLAPYYYCSDKYDGNYVQIIVKDGTVECFTSGGKQFIINGLSTTLIRNNPGKNFKLECEYTNQSLGKLGDRIHAAKLTTYRTAFKNNTFIPQADEHYKVFDIIDTELDFLHRLKAMKHINLEGTPLEFVQHVRVQTFKLMFHAQDRCVEGWEGIVAKSPMHMQKPGKRVNDAIKLKFRKEATLVCIGIVPGIGKYSDMIGALILQDEDDITVSVGSGLCDAERKYKPEDFIGQKIEIEYEQMLETYIQPVYKRIAR